QLLFHCVLGGNSGSLDNVNQEHSQKNWRGFNPAYWLGKIKDVSSTKNFNSHSTRKCSQYAGNPSNVFPIGWD
ncbi:hypothetical protein WDU94_012123, partial [Cyamophila willieti]